MNLEFIPNDKVTYQEMLSLAESVGFGPHRSLDRNKTALAGSIFVASACRDGDLIGLIRLVGDGAYILHLADLEVHPDFQRRGVGRRLMEMAIEFAREAKIGTGENFGEFTLFADVDADAFYEKLGFILTPNGMVLTDTESRRKTELEFQKEWTKKREER
jgi:GNAT superfamily N-acetyltransferase